MDWGAGGGYHAQRAGGSLDKKVENDLGVASWGEGVAVHRQE